MTPRLPEWPTRFREAIAALSGRPFQWGTADCACTASAVVEALTGVDPLARFRGAYTTHNEARAAVAAAGFTGWADAAAAVFADHGWPEIDARAARVGDVGIATGGTFVFRTVSGFAARLDDGWASIQPEAVLQVWGIG